MVTDNINLKSVADSYFGDVANNVRLFVLMLATAVLLLPSATQADGLFDFQMKLAKKGNAEAEYKVGEMYETGFGVKKDMKKAMNWIKKSAGQGHETAKFKLLYWNVEKNGVTKTNKAEVVALTEKARNGNAQAQFYTGKMYAHGVGVKKNSDKAIGWLNKAALVGVLAAERELTAVREGRQRQAQVRANEKRRTAEKRQEELKAKHEGERQARIENQRKLHDQNQAKAKDRAEERAKQNEAAKRSAQAAMLARKEEAARKHEAKKQADDEKKHKSGACSGKTARFKSTCR